LFADVASPVNVRFERDRLARSLDRFEHRGEDLIAVEECVDVVAVDDRRSEEMADRAAKLSTAHGVLVLDAEMRILRAQHRDVAHDRRRAPCHAGKTRNEEGDDEKVGSQGHRHFYIARGRVRWGRGHFVAALRLRVESLTNPRDGLR
jgi:hypothetical protein